MLNLGEIKPKPSDDSKAGDFDFNFGDSTTSLHT